MAAMAKKPLKINILILLPHIPDTWHPMVYCFIPATSFLKNTKMVHSLHSMVHGTAHLSLRLVSSWYFSHLKMANQTGNGKYLPMDLQVQKKRPKQADQII